MDPEHVDYAVPASVESSRTVLRRSRERGESGALWGGRARRLLVGGCWALAVVLLLVLLVPLLSPDETGADSPEEAVEQLLQGIADVDPVAIVAVVDPEETGDPDRARAAYDELATRLTRQGEEPGAAIDDVVATAEGQVGGSGDLASVAVLARLALELEGLELTALDSEAGPDGTDVRHVVVDDGRLDVALGDASYTMPLAEGWRADGAPVRQPGLTTVRRDGRWYVSLGATGDRLLGGGR
jgi:hypothetical protein